MPVSELVCTAANPANALPLVVAGLALTMLAVLRAAKAPEAVEPDVEDALAAQT